MAKQVSIRIEKDNSEEVLKELSEAVERALVAVGAQAQNYASMLCPVDTGRLRDSITYATRQEASTVGSKAKSEDAVPPPNRDNAVNIGTRVEYAIYQETGSYKHETGMSPFLRPAIENHLNEYRTIIEEQLKN